MSESKSNKVERVAKDEDKVVTDKAAENLQNETERMLAPTTEAERTWQEVKDVKVDMFSLPRQTVEMHVKPVDIDPSALYVELNSPAVLPELEKVLSDRFTVEQADRFIKVTRK